MNNDEETLVPKCKDFRNRHSYLKLIRGWTHCKLITAIISIRKLRLMGSLPLQNVERDAQMENHS